MSVRLMSAVFKLEIEPITLRTDPPRRVEKSTLKLVLLAMADSANDDGDGTYNSRSTLQTKTGLAYSALAFAVNALKQEEFITYAGLSKRGTANYSMSLSKMGVLTEDGKVSSQRTGGVLTEDGKVSSQRTISILNPSINPPKASASQKKGSARPDERAILEAFCEESGIPEPHPNTTKENKTAAALWWQPVRRMCQLANGGGPDFARQAVRKLRRDNLTVSCPASIEKTFTALYSSAKTSPQGTPEL